jgi:hypothetical protein
MLMGIALAGNNSLRLRRACVWVIVCCGTSALLLFGMAVYAIIRGDASISGTYLVYLLVDTLSLLFPVAWVLLSISLLRKKEMVRPGTQLDEF